MTSNECSVLLQNLKNILFYKLGSYWLVVQIELSMWQELGHIFIDFSGPTASAYPL